MDTVTYWNNDKFYNAQSSKKQKINLQQDNLFVFRDENLLYEHQGIYYLDLLLVFIFYSFFIFALSCFIKPSFFWFYRSLNGHDFYRIFDLFFFSYFDNYFFNPIKTFFFMHYPVLAHQQLSVSNDFFYVAKGYNFPLTEVYDWWHGDVFKEDNDFWFFSTPTEFLRERFTDDNHIGALGLGKFSRTPPRQSYSLFYDLPEDSKKWLRIKHELINWRWKRQYSYFNHNPQVKRYYFKMGDFQKKVISQKPWMKQRSFFFDWFYMTKVINWYNWNKKAVLPIMTFSLTCLILWLIHLVDLVILPMLDITFMDSLIINCLFLWIFLIMFASLIN